MARGPPKDIFSRSFKQSNFKTEENGSIRRCVKLKNIISTLILIQAPTDPIYFNGSLQRSKLKVRGNGSIKNMYKAEDYHMHIHFNASFKESKLKAGRNKLIRNQSCSQ